MASDVVLSAGVRQNLLALQNTARLMSITQNRLATGRRVNTALDNPINFFTASALQSRASDLSALLDAMSNGIKTLEAADNGIKAIKNTIESMQATLRQARQDKSFQTDSYTLGNVGTATLKNLTFAGGSVGTTPVSIALNSADVGGSITTTSTTLAYAPPAAATQPLLTAAGAFAALDMTTGDETYSFDVTLDGGAAVGITLDTADNTGGGATLTLAEAVAGINADLATAGSDVRVRDSLTTPGNLEFFINAGTHTGSTSSILVDNFANGGTSPSLTTSFGFGASQSDSGADAESHDFSINGTAISLAAGTTLTQAIQQINTTLGPAHAFEAFDDAGKLGIHAKSQGATALSITGADAALFAAVTLGTAPTTAGTLKTVDTLVAEINNSATLNNKIRASNDNGQLRIENLSTADLTVTGVDANGNIDGGAAVSTIGGNNVRRNLVNQYNELRDQLDKLSDDSSFNGVNLLRGDKLTLTFNETGTSSIVIQAKDLNNNPTAINAFTLDIDALTNVDFDADTTIDTRLDELNISLATLRSQASNFGSNLFIVQNRTEFTKSMINTLETGADTLVLADINEEGANMLALQTRQQLSTTALALSSQADQAVLRLFG
jgi:flagellin-like hook-associated protein FlgL